MTEQKTKKVKISEVQPNTGQVKGLAKNPRLIRGEKFDKLVKSIKEFPEMLELRPIVVDENMVVLGGNMRLKACEEAGFTEIYVLEAKNLTIKQKNEFLIKDNVGFGEWEWELLSTEWKIQEVIDWGLDVIGFDVEDEDLTDEFTLPDGDKAPFQQQTYTLADEQAEQIKIAIADVKKTEEFKYCETFANENGNGNALYLIIMQWVEQKR